VIQIFDLAEACLPFFGGLAPRVLWVVFVDVDEELKLRADSIKLDALASSRIFVILLLFGLLLLLGLSLFLLCLLFFLACKEHACLGLHVLILSA